MAIQTHGGFVKLGDFMRSTSMMKSESPTVNMLAILLTVMPDFGDQSTEEDLIAAFRAWGGLDESAIQAFASEIFNGREPKCTICGDTGWEVKQDIFRNDVGGERPYEYVVRCQCQSERAKKRQGVIAYEHFDTVNWQDMTFAKFKPRGTKEDIVRAYHFLQKWDACEAQKAFVILHGTVGNGKTHLATAWLIDQFTRLHRKESWFVRCGRLSDLLAKVKLAPETDAELDLSRELAQYQDAACLVIDDLQGLHLANSNSYTIKKFTEFVDYRYRNNLQTVVTLNFDLGVDSSKLGEFNDVLSSRIYGDGKTQVFAFLDYDRRSKKK